jgi:acetolactate synthase-1/2/3 large subunit
MTATIARDIAATLKGCGLAHFFMLTGGDQPLWIALRDAGIRMLVARSEASAVYMADGFARASGGPAVAYGQAGPGAANVAAALADPWWAQSPVIALTGANATTAMHVNEYQSIDQHTMFGPVTKWNGNVAHAAQAASLTRKAVQLAISGTPGPTHLDIPKDFFGLPSPGLPIATMRPLPRETVDPIDGATVVPFVEALTRAQRPALLVGEGVRTARAGDEVAALAAAAGLPLFATMGGKPAVPNAHPNFVGIVGRYSSVTANALLAEADCVLALGTRLGGLATNGYRIPSPETKLLQIDRDPAAFANPYFPELCLRADLRAATLALANAMRISPTSQATAWLKRCRSAAGEWQTRLSEQTEAARGRKVLSPLTVLEELRHYASEITLVADTGYMAAWTGVLFPVERPDAFFRATGSLGWALPAALGVQLARQEKVVCIIGDGGVGYHLADIETAVRYRLPVVIIILNNDCLAFEYHEQKYRWNGNIVAEVNDFTRVDYGRAAEGLGAIGRRVETPHALHGALKEAMRSLEPFVLDVAVDKEAFPPVTNFDAHLKRPL